MWFWVAIARGIHAVLRKDPSGRPPATEEERNQNIGCNLLLLGLILLVVAAKAC